MKTIHLDRAIGVDAGELSARWLRSQLDAAGGDNVTLQVHSQGGSVFEALAMFDALRAYRGRVHAVVSSMALSAGSLILMACDEVSVSENGYIMCHAPHSEDSSSTTAERRLLSSMEQRMLDLYAERTKQPRATIAKLMRDEVFLDARESVRLGFADKVASSIAARGMPHRIAASVGGSASVRWRAAIASTGLPFAKAAATVDKQQPGLRAAMVREANANRRQR